jgi:hypothetical protein
MSSVIEVRFAFVQPDAIVVEFASVPVDKAAKIRQFAAVAVAPGMENVVPAVLSRPVLKMLIGDPAVVAPRTPTIRAIRWFCGVEVIDGAVSPATARR